MYVTRPANKFIKSAQRAAQERRSPIIDLQNEIVEMYDRHEGVEEGVEKMRGRRFIRWSFRKRLGANNTAQIVAKLHQDVNRTFYVRHSYSYVLVNNENGLRMVFFKQQKGSPWINTFGEAERWVNEEENKRLNVDNIERPNTKWVFVKFSSIEVKAVLDNQPMLGTGPLPDWLRNLAHGRNMISLDIFRDNLCLWCCIAVHQGARPDRCTQAAKQLAKGFFKEAPVPRTSLDELDKVERYLNQGKQLSEWLGIRVYEPEWKQKGAIHWHLINKDITKLAKKKLAKTYVGSNCRG